MIASMAPDGRHAVRLRRFIGHTAANLLDVEEVTTSEGLHALAPAWDGLHERAGLTHPFLTHAWMRTFWDAYGEPGTLYVLVVRRYGQVVAIAPFARRRRTIYGVSVRAIEMLRHPDAPRSDFLLSTHPIEACGAVLEHLVRRSRDWDVLDMAHFPETSVAYREVRRIARQAGLLTGAIAAVRSHRSLLVFPDHFRARCLYLAKFGVVPRLRRSGLLRALRDALARNEEPS